MSFGRGYLTAAGAEPDNFFDVNRAVRINSGGKVRGEQAYGSAAAVAFEIRDKMVFGHFEFIFLLVGIVPVVGHGYGLGGAVISAGTAEAAGIVPDSVMIACFFFVGDNADGIAAADVLAYAAAYA